MVSDSGGGEGGEVGFRGLQLLVLRLSNSLSPSPSLQEAQTKEAHPQKTPMTTERTHSRRREKDKYIRLFFRIYRNMQCTFMFIKPIMPVCDDSMTNRNCKTAFVYVTILVCILNTFQESLFRKLLPFLRHAISSFYPRSRNKKSPFLHKGITCSSCLLSISSETRIDAALFDSGYFMLED